MYILLNYKDNENPEALGFFLSVKSAKEHAKELELEQEHAAIFKLDGPKNYILDKK